jgi:hypothetical protein
MIGGTNRLADLGIPRTQAEQSGSGLGARRPSSRATASDFPQATPSLRRRSTLPPPPPRPGTRPGPVSGRRQSRSGREQASATAPGHTAGTGAARTGQLSAPVRAGMLSIYWRASNTGRQAIPVRSGPWGLPGLLAGGAGSGCWHAAADQWIAQSFSDPGSGLHPVDFLELRHCEDGGLDPPVPIPRDVHPGQPPAPWISGALSSRARRQSSRAKRWGAPGPLSPRVDRRGLRHCGDGGLDPPVPIPRDVHPVQPPAPWISGALSPRPRRQSSRAKRWEAPGPLPPPAPRVDAPTPAGHRPSTVSHALQSAGLRPGQWVGQRARSGQYRGPSSSWRGRSAHSVMLIKWNVSLIQFL